MLETRRRIIYKGKKNLDGNPQKTVSIYRENHKKTK